MNRDPYEPFDPTEHLVEGEAVDLAGLWGIGNRELEAFIVKTRDEIASSKLDPASPPFLLLTKLLEAAERDWVLRGLPAPSLAPTRVEVLPGRPPVLTYMQRIRKLIGC